LNPQPKAVIPFTQYIPELTVYADLSSFAIDKGKPDQSQGRKATGPRFLRHAFRDATKDTKIAGLPG